MPNTIDFVVRDQFLAENSQIVVEVEQKSQKKALSLMIKKIGDYYENC